VYRNTGLSSHFDANRITFAEAGSSLEAKRWAGATQRSNRKKPNAAKALNELQRLLAEGKPEDLQEQLILMKPFAFVSAMTWGWFPLAE
jgi:hypothetical protein